jgi:predicted phosphodiesterase
MRVAAIYDIHGNLPALEAVLEDIRRAGVDQVVVGGDVLPGPMPVQTIDCLRGLGLPVRCLRGNGDRDALAWVRGDETASVPEAFRDAMRWVARQLRDADKAWLDSWPPAVTLDLGDLGGDRGEVLFCHATPRNDTEIFTRATPADRLAPVFAGLRARLVVCGHTHMQFDRTVGATRVVNAGSVGMPFGRPGAYWALLGPSAVELRHTAYDLAAAAARIRATRYPQAEDFAARNVLLPPSEEEMLAALGRAELRPG